MFSSNFMNLMNLYDIEHLLPDCERIEMYEKIFEELNNEDMIHDILPDIIDSLKNYYYNLKNKKSVLLFLFRRKFEKIINKHSLTLNHKHVYSDNQNVHEFVSDTLKIAKTLIQTFPAKYHRLSDHVFFDVIETITTKNYGLNGTDLFASVYFYINNHKHRNEMLKRLSEEMNESVGTCSSGHITRLINSIKGFGFEFEVMLGEYEAEKAKIFNEINKNIDVFDLFSIHDFEKLINSDIIKFPIDSKITLNILKDYSKFDWYTKIVNKKVIYFPILDLWDKRSKDIVQNK